MDKEVHDAQAGIAQGGRDGWKALCVSQRGRRGQGVLNKNGQPFQCQIQAHPLHAACNRAKLTVGRCACSFKDKEVQRDAKLVSYKVVDKGGKPYVSVNVAGEDKVFSPEEISAMILTKMKETAGECTTC